MSDSSSGQTQPQANYSQRTNAAYKRSDKSIVLVILFATFLPTVHRLYVGKIGTGILFFITLGGLGIWWVYDVISAFTGKFTDKQGRKVGSGTSIYNRIKNGRDYSGEFSV
jgi:TM2 domain-containing membrane protein YozV